MRSARSVTQENDLVDYGIVEDLIELAFHNADSGKLATTFPDSELGEA